MDESGSPLVGTRSSKSSGKRVGVLELLSLPASGPVRIAESLGMTRQYASLTPQSISVWCRNEGHDVTYATYYGLGDPIRLMPADLDVLFIATTTMVSPLAYAIAKVFRARGVLCALGGPHTLAFPDDCRRYFDIVVLDCDEALIARQHGLFCGALPRHPAGGGTASRDQEVRLHRRPAISRLVRSPVDEHGLPVHVQLLRRLGQPLPRATARPAATGSRVRFRESAPGDPWNPGSELRRLRR